METESQSTDTARATLAPGAGACYADERLMGLSAIADRLTISVRTLHRLIAKGEFPPPMKVGHASRWYVADVERYLHGLRKVRRDGQVDGVVFGGES
jgi:predicted DNA-binding transcriptional regulator AlpA